MDFNLKINGAYVLGEIKVDGVMYYIDENKNIYVFENGEYVKVDDTSRKEKVFKYISPVSIDLKE